MSNLKKIQEWLPPSIDAILVPKANTFQSDFFVENRLCWLTSFDGSFGLCLVAKDHALLFVDGRYTLQAKIQATECEILSISDFYTRIQNYQNLAFDPWLHTCDEVQNLKKHPINLIPLDHNPLDIFCQSCPQKQIAKLHPYSSRTFNEKRAFYQGSTDLLLTCAESVSWLFNIRAFPFSYTPVVNAYAYLEKSGKTYLFSDVEINDCDLDVEALPFDHLVPFLKGKTFQADKGTIPYKLYLENPAVLFEANPFTHPKAIKDACEQKGAKFAHLCDGKAWKKLLAWLNNHKTAFEKEIVHTLEVFRKEEASYLGPSFETIAGFGSNGAIIHYRPTGNTKLAQNNLLLLDAGAQYALGTTDATRTIAIGEASLEQKEIFTRVLKGHIALATIHFPIGTTGGGLDTLARQFLWNAGYDYPHGTGHGVGSFLNVHEGPQRISKNSTIPLIEGMIVSNEPGFYLENHYGIRFENLMLVIKSCYEGFLTFETLTLIPIDLNLVCFDFLTPFEKQWIENYHAQIKRDIG